MAKLTLDLPDELRDRLDARAAAEGYDSVDAYVAGLIRDDVCDDLGAPEQLRVRSEADLAAKIQEGLDSPVSVMTDQDWADMRRRLLDRHGGR
ncbi:MAG: hypothetical protein ACAI43_16190 [Phycisphaerae bacterium]|nr:hypothetical protein [Tepidisphaeraceae bacterium]